MAPELIKCFSEKYPTIAISLEVQGVDRTLDSAAGGGHDFAMTGGHLADGSMECLTLATTEAVCLVPETHPLARHTVICPQDLEGEPFVSYRADAGQRNRIDAVFAANHEGQCGKLAGLDWQTNGPARPRPSPP